MLQTNILITFYLISTKYKKNENSQSTVRLIIMKAVPAAWRQPGLSRGLQIFGNRHTDFLFICISFQGTFESKNNAGNIRYNIIALHQHYLTMFVWISSKC